MTNSLPAEESQEPADGTSNTDVLVTVIPPRSRATLAKRFRRLVQQATLLNWRARCRSAARTDPDRAAAMVSQLWCQLPSNGGRRKDLRPYPGTVSQVDGPGGAKLTVETWGTGPRVYLVHGWGGWRGQLGAFVEPLVEAGFQVIGFDSLSHGESEAGKWGPKASNGGEMTRSLQAVISAFGPAHGIVAHSLGCSTATWTALNSSSATWLALIAPNQDLVPQVIRFAALLGLPDSLDAAVVNAMAATAQMQVSAFSIISTMAKGTTSPVLVVHDRLDKECPYQTSVDLAEAVPSIQLTTTVGLGHQRILSNDAVVAHITEWAQRQRKA